MIENAYAKAFQDITDSWAKQREHNILYLTKVKGILSRTAERVEETARLSSVYFMVNTLAILTVFGISFETAKELITTIITD